MSSLAGLNDFDGPAYPEFHPELHIWRRYATQKNPSLRGKTVAEPRRCETVSKLPKERGSELPLRKAAASYRTPSPFTATFTWRAEACFSPVAQQLAAEMPVLGGHVCHNVPSEPRCSAPRSRTLIRLFISERTVRSLGRFRLCFKSCGRKGSEPRSFETLREDVTPRSKKVS